MSLFVLPCPGPRHSGGQRQGEEALSGGRLRAESQLRPFLDLEQQETFPTSVPRSCLFVKWGQGQYNPEIVHLRTEMSKYI